MTITSNTMPHPYEACVCVGSEEGKRKPHVTSLFTYTQKGLLLDSAISSQTPKNKNTGTCDTGPAVLRTAS